MHHQCAGEEGENAEGETTHRVIMHPHRTICSALETYVTVNEWPSSNAAATFCDICHNNVERQIHKK